MAKKKPSSPRKKGNGKPKGSIKGLALDNSTSEAALKKAIERQRKAMESGEMEKDPYALFDPLDPNSYVETLLQVPNRKPLEDPGPDEVMSNNRLIRFIHDRPAQYKRFISLLKEGATLASAGFACKFATPPLVRMWLNRGMQDASEEKDTFYSRLFSDIAGANAEKRAEVEILIAEEDPKFWLQSGPGKYLDDEWKPRTTPRGAIGTNNQAEPEQIEGANTLRITAKVEESDDEIEGEMLGKAPVEDNMYQQALDILKESGMSPDQQPEGWLKALKIQAGEQLSEEELEVKDDECSPISLGSNEALLTEQQRQAQSSLPC